MERAKLIELRDRLCEAIVSCVPDPGTSFVLHVEELRHLDFMVTVHRTICDQLKSMQPKDNCCRCWKPFRNEATIDVGNGYAHWNCLTSYEKTLFDENSLSAKGGAS